MLALPKPSKAFYAFWVSYDLALKQGNKKFGSVCKHGKVKNGKCLNCFRIVK
jgi:hypothetical protein